MGMQPRTVETVRGDYAAFRAPCLLRRRLVPRFLQETRTWGSPHSVFLGATALGASQILVRRTWIVNGELIEREIDAFIRERLGLAPREPDDS